MGQEDEWELQVLKKGKGLLSAGESPGGQYVCEKQPEGQCGWSVAGCLGRSQGLKESRSGLWRVSTGGGVWAFGWVWGRGRMEFGFLERPLWWCVRVWRWVGLGSQSCRRNPDKGGKGPGSSIGVSGASQGRGDGSS